MEVLKWLVDLVRGAQTQGEPTTSAKPLPRWLRFSMYPLIAGMFFLMIGDPIKKGVDAWCGFDFAKAYCSRHSNQPADNVPDAGVIADAQQAATSESALRPSTATSKSIPPVSELRSESEPQAAWKSVLVEPKRKQPQQKEFQDAGCPESSCPWMVVIPTGRFALGSPASEPGRRDTESPQTTITIARPFAIGKFEVSFDEWDACVAADGCKHRPGDHGWGRGRRPVMNVSWDDARQYARWLSRITQQRYRLPTEAEWEYAARANTTTAYPWGEQVGNRNAVCSSCGTQFDDERTAPVGSFRPNGFGLYDMNGNVWEWVEDPWSDNYAGRPSDQSAAKGDPDFRVFRGGSWFSRGIYVRSAHRWRENRSHRYFTTGFRIARDL